MELLPLHSIALIRDTGITHAHVIITRVGGKHSTNV